MVRDSFISGVVPAAHARSKRSRNTRLPTPDDGTPDVDPLGLQTCLRNRGVPFEVLNDGDVTALAASMSLEKNAIIGMAENDGLF
jgi:hypothetical protein